MCMYYAHVEEHYVTLVCTPLLYKPDLKKTSLISQQWKRDKDLQASSPSADRGLQIIIEQTSSAAC